MTRKKEPKIKDTESVTSDTWKGSPVLIEYGRLLTDIKDRVRSAQYEALRAVNKELTGLYRDIGKMIVERKIVAKHGDPVAEKLACDLRAEFPGVSGFSRRNIFYMCQFYTTYKSLPKVQPLVAQIG